MLGVFHSKWPSTRLILSNNSYIFLAAITGTYVAMKLSLNWAMLPQYDNISYILEENHCSHPLLMIFNISLVDIAGFIQIYL